MYSHCMTKALIIGGGIAGPVTAMALQRAGIDSVVYEAYGHGADGIGAYLTLAVNGLAALDELGLLETVTGLGFETPRMRFLSGTGKVLGGFPNGPRTPSRHVSRTVTRGDLYRALRDETLRRGIEVRHGRRLTDARPTADGVTAIFADGSQAHGDLLIGCDGLQSRTRRLIDPKAPEARYTGLLNTGGYATGVEVPDDVGVMNMIFGKRAFFCYMKHPDGSLWWFANPPQAAEPTPAELAAITPEQWRARLLDLFRADTGPAVAAIDATETIMAPWGTYDFPSVPVWRSGRMVIVGDAAHATSPSSGQGASMAIEDALVLARCLRDRPDVPSAFASYENQRRRRVERIVALGKRSGDGKAAGPVARVIRDLMLPMVFRHLATSDSRDWVFDHQLRWDDRVTR